MRIIYLSLIILCAYPSLAQKNNYEKGWEALNNNNTTQALSYFKQAIESNTQKEDAYISNLYLKTYTGKEKEVSDFAKSFYNTSINPYAYLYALWFNDAVIGDYGKKQYIHQLKFADEIIADKNAPGSIKAAANYQRGMHTLFSYNFSQAQSYFDGVGNIRNWQYTGPFENLSETGFYKNHGPFEHPEPTAIFKSLTNADIKWFTPASEIKDGWTPVIYQVNRGTAVVYAQNFLSSPIDQEVIFNVGFTGALKAWLNDELLISEARELTTELDAYSVRCSLKKGVNRVLIQLSYSNNSYPNFTLRLTDDKYLPLNNLSGSPVYAPYPKKSSLEKTSDILPHFAEKYFTESVSKSPSNLVNYLLLADVYMRNRKLLEARNVINKALAIAPRNSLLRMKLIQVLNQDNNQTLLQEELEKIKIDDPNCVTVMDLNIKELIDGEKYEDAEEELEKRIKIHGEDATTLGYRVQFLIHDKKYEELVKEGEKFYALYPDNSKLISMMYTIKKEVYKDQKAGMKIYEKFMKENYNYGVFEEYARLLAEQGNHSKSMDIKQVLMKQFPYDPSMFYKVSTEYYASHRYDKAEEFIQKALALNPHNEIYWKQLGDIKSELNKKEEALNAYHTSLRFEPNQYDVLNKIRKLNGKSELNKLFPGVDVAKMIKDDNIKEAKNTDHGYYYILDQKDVIQYADGANEQYYTFIIKITNDKGIERYKESSIGYGNNQRLIIEKAEVIKKSNSRIEGERNDNEIVFSSLEIGDVIVFKYKLQSFVYGRFAKEFWDKYHMNGQIYSGLTRYNLLLPAGQKVIHEMHNGVSKPSITDIEGYKLYSWETSKMDPLSDEPLMPEAVDISMVLHLSTIQQWKDISSWYSDVANNKSEEDIEITELYKELFPAGIKKMSEFEKARKIYDYLQANIKYSSVSFRQSAFVPQRPSKTLSSRLGDCKDLSSLFVTLAHMAGLTAQMVLVNTRDNGQFDVILPGVEFNHCIVKTILDGKNYYIELTDNYLPFASVPYTLNGAIILEIPSKSISQNADLKYLATDSRTTDRVKRIIDIKPSGNDLNVSVKTIKYGSNTSYTRYTYLNLDSEKQVKEMEKTISSSYKNTVKLDKLSFSSLDKLIDSVEYDYNYRIKNEVAEIGSIKTFKIAYPDIIASLDNFSEGKRNYPVEYWKYEIIDTYDNLITITAPDGFKFIEIPTNQKLEFKGMKYSLKYELKSPGKLLVKRVFSNDRPQQVSAGEYDKFIDFFEKIVEAEQKFIAYKK